MVRKDMSKKKRRTRRKFSREYKAEVVRLCQLPGKSAHTVAAELGLTESAVRNWVDQAKVDQGDGVAGALTTAERDELSALRREVRTLRQERDILKRATALFAREATS
jgi:transposase